MGLVVMSLTISATSGSSLLQYVGCRGSVVRAAALRLHAGGGLPYWGSRLPWAFSGHKTLIRTLVDYVFRRGIGGRGFLGPPGDSIPELRLQWV